MFVDLQTFIYIAGEHYIYIHIIFPSYISFAKCPWNCACRPLAFLSFPTPPAKSSSTAPFVWTPSRRDGWDGAFSGWPWVINGTYHSWDTRPGKHTKNYGKWPFIVSFPIKHGGSFHSYVKLPEGMCITV